MFKTGLLPIACLASLVFLAPALAADPAASGFKAGYDAGYKAAMEALKGAQAVAAAGPTAVPHTSAAAAPNGPPDWWNHSSLAAPRLDPAWRHRVEVRVGGTSLSGNDSGHAISGGGKLYSRSGRWTNELVVSIDKRRILQGGGGVSQRDYRMLEDSIRYDLSDKLYAATGLILERDDVNSIDHRTTVLAGAGYYLVDTPKLRINTFAGLGRLRESYLEPVPALIGIDGRSSGLVYLYQTLDWQLAENWSLQQGLRHIHDLDESGRYGDDPNHPGAYRALSMVKRYRTVGSLALTYQLSPRSAISASVESRFDSNPWPDVQGRDTVRRLSLNLMH